MAVRFLLIILWGAFSCCANAGTTSQQEIEDYEIGSGERAILKAMQESFANIRRNKISKENMDECEQHFSQYTSNDEIWRVQAISSTIAYKIICSSCLHHSPTRRIDNFKKFFRKTLEKYPFEGGIDFFISFGPDKRTTPEWSREPARLIKLLENVPFFLFDMSPADEIRKRSIQLPDFFIQDHGYQISFTKICLAGEQAPFEKRKDVIKWLGVATGVPPTLGNLPLSNRCKLVILSKLFPHRIDASFTRYGEFDWGEERKKLKTVFEILQGEPVAYVKPDKLYTETKYSVSLDGNIGAWERVPQILTSGSVLLLQYQFSQYFYHGMKPWVHYVPLKEDISDILEKHDWLQKNPASAKKIAENGQKFADECLSPAALEKYFGAVLAELSKHYTYTLTETTLGETTLGELPAEKSLIQAS